MEIMKTVIKTILAIGALGLSAQAHAIMISPSTGTLGTDRFETSSNSNLSSLSAINTAFGTSFTSASLQYKFNTGNPGTEEGTLSGSYEADNVAGGVGDESGLDINYSGSGNIVVCATECFVIVKDGNNTPAQYLFILSTAAIGIWNGTDELEFSGFWPSNGAISNVALWGGSGSPPPPDQLVPAPAPLALLGLGLLGLGIRRRNRR